MIDRNSSVPFFRQIVEHFEKMILRGEIAPGAALPPERKLADFLGLNRSTVQSAYEELRSAGLVVSIRGSGTKVTDELWGVSPRKVPDWSAYTESGVFLPTLPLVRRIRSASSNTDLIDLSSSELSSDLLPSNVLNMLLSTTGPIDSFNYPNPRGDYSLRQIVCSHLKKHFRVTTRPENILITSGAQQALHLIVHCLLNTGDFIAIEGPSYAYSLPLFASAGIRLARIPMDKHGLLPDEIVNLHEKQKVRMVIVNPTFQNPSGSTLTLDRRKKLLEICENLKLPIVEDDAYGALTHIDAPESPPTLIGLSNDTGSVIYVGSLSKTAAPGLRIGWVVGPTSVIERLADSKQQMDFGTSIIVQKIVQGYLSGGHWERNVQMIRRSLTLRRQVLVDSLDRIIPADMTYHQPDGGYHLWCRVKRPIIDEKSLLEVAISHGILFVPGTVFGSERGYIRLSFARATEDEIKEGVRRLSQLLKNIA